MGNPKLAWAPGGAAQHRLYPHAWEHASPLRALLLAQHPPIPTNWAVQLLEDKQELVQLADWTIIMAV